MVNKRWHIMWFLDSSASCQCYEPCNSTSVKLTKVGCEFDPWCILTNHCKSDCSYCVWFLYQSPSIYQLQFITSSLDSWPFCWVMPASCQRGKGARHSLYITYFQDTRNRCVKHSTSCIYLTLIRVQNFVSLYARKIMTSVTWAASSLHSSLEINLYVESSL